jgi:hypothetical protein
MLCSDNHGDAIDIRTAKAFLSRKRDFKPDVVIHLGDNWDFKSIRRGASAEEKACSMIDDFHAGCDFMNEVFKGKHENYQLIGNHCYRIWEVADGADGPKSDAAQMIIEKMGYIFKRLNVKTTPFDTRKGILKLGKLGFIHGYCHAQNAAKKHAEVYGGSLSHIFAGDLHANIYWKSASIDPVVCQHIPCMTQLDPEYARRHINKLKHSQGWCEITLHNDYVQYQVIESDKKGKFHAYEKTKSY